MSDIYQASAAFAANANSNQAAYAQEFAAEQNNSEAFWLAMANRLQWYTSPTQGKDVSYALDDFRIRWFADG